MNRTLVALMVSLVALPALAGCLGGDDDPPTTTEPGGECGEQCKVEGGDLGEGLGRISGQVIDDTFTPIKGANVTLRELSLTTKTNAEGRYAFNDLEPGVYTIFAQNPPTHKAAGDQFQVVASNDTVADLILTLLPPPAVPYLVEDDKSGSIGCSVAREPLRGRDLCERFDESAVSQLSWQLGPHMNSLVIVLESPAGSPTSAKELAVTIINPIGIDPDSVTGEAPITARWDFTKETAYPSWSKDNQTITFEVIAGYEQATPQVAYQQKFTLYVAFFYNGMEVPDGYSPRGDG